MGSRILSRVIQHASWTLEVSWYDGQATSVACTVTDAADSSSGICGIRRVVVFAEIES